MRKIVRGILKFVTFVVLSTICALAFLAFVAAVMLFPTSLFTRIIAVIVLAVSMFMTFPYYR